MKKNQKSVRLPGGYVVRGLLGCGALGDSYLAFKRGDEEKRVFKILRHADWLDDVPVLRVPGVWIGGKSPTGEPAWIWSRYVEQGSLRAAMDRGTLPARDLGAILMRSLEILERVHAEKKIHGCLKPEDILLPEREGVVITDFGHLPLLRSRDEEAGAAYLFGRVVSREIRAPIAYLPAEAMGANVPDPRGDVYAVGAILREGLEGKGGRPPIPPRLKEVIRTLTASPSSDYPSAGEARALLAAVPDEEWETVPLIGESAGGPEKDESFGGLVSFVEIPDRPDPVAVGLPAELAVFDVAGEPPAKEARAEDAPDPGGRKDEPEPLDPKDALRFLESMKSKKKVPEKEAEEMEEMKDEVEKAARKTPGAYGLVVMGVPGGSKQEQIADLIGPILRITKEEALEKASEPVISVLRGVSKLEAEKAYKRFKDAKVSARITTRLKKQTGR